jgi:hypothetical protein
MAKEEIVKATLEFNEEEINEFKLAVKGSDFYYALSEIQNELRDYDRYSKQAKDCINRIREIVYDSGMEEIE